MLSHAPLLPRAPRRRITEGGEGIEVAVGMADGKASIVGVEYFDSVRYSTIAELDPARLAHVFAMR